jgi:2,3-bisphosphoglycerate-dependent phosphoglycerate mutase
MKGKLILMRHGQSRWNELNLFTGWVDVPLSEKGIAEAFQGGQRIKDLPIDIIFTSTLVRAQTTAFLAMSLHSSGKVPVVLHPGEGRLDEWGKIYSEATRAQTIPVVCSWHLNERMYGELQGLNKAETMEKYGKEQVQIWRRSYDVPPPGGESLKDTAARTIPYFKKEIVPHLDAGKNVFISAHGNSLRSIVMDLDGLTKEQVLQLEIATGEPLFYTFQGARWKKES